VKVLHVVPTYLPAWRHGGPVFAVHGLCRALARRGHAVTVFTTDVHGAGSLPPEVPRGEPVEIDGVEVRYFPVETPRRLYRSPALAAALGAEVGGFEIAHLHSVFLRPTAVAARAAEWAGVPYLLAPRGMLVPDLIARRGALRKLLWLHLVERRTLAAAAGLHATTELEARDAARLGLPLPPVYVVPNGIEVEGDPAHRGSEGGYVLFLGRLSWKKGLDRLIPALARAPGAELVVAGNDEEGLRPELERLAERHGVAGRVRFPGPVHGEEKAALLRGAAVVVLPSRSENFGNVVLEAMAAGRPVVVTPEVGLADAVLEEQAGLVAAGDPESLGSALTTLLADPKTAEAMGRRGAGAARRRFGWDAVAGRMEAVYRCCLAGGRSEEAA
jgi:glycosyltransferase involved in cell wall biosynthesis